MAIYEMVHVPDIPAKVSINEAIELGKRYSTQQSGSFINGILDRIRRERQL
jgi:N utilization substance protein B